VKSQDADGSYLATARREAALLKTKLELVLIN